MTPDFDAAPLAALQQRRSIKWRLHPADVLPVWVAELDVPLAEPVRAVLARAVEQGDTGYCEAGDLGRAFSGFAGRRWGWRPDPSRCWPVSDVMGGVAAALTALLAPGEGVVICPPVYHPFFVVPDEVGRPAVPVPLREGRLDLAGIDAALAAGARAVLLCSPHNPTGSVWSAEELAALDDVVRPYDALVVSDEVHAPLTLPGATFTPYLQAGERDAVAVVSASKAFNTAGLKAALLVAGSERVQERLRGALPPALSFRVGHFGVLAGVAAYDEGDAWLDALLAHLDRNRDLLGRLLAERVPQAGYHPPAASYLGWLDLSSLGDHPGPLLLERGRVALVDGEEFGAGGLGHARLNFGTTRAVLTEAVDRIAAAVG